MSKYSECIEKMAKQLIQEIDKLVMEEAKKPKTALVCPYCKSSDWDFRIHLDYCQVICGNCHARSSLKNTMQEAKDSFLMEAIK